MKVISNSLNELLSSSNIELAQEITSLCNNDIDISDKISCVTIRDIKTLSYLPAKKPIEYNSTGKWTRKNRQEGKIGKVLRKLCIDYNITFCDADIEKLTNHIKTAYVNGDFRIVEGKDIAFWYDNYQYKQKQGSLNQSCMRYMSTLTFDVYVKNPAFVKMLVLIDDGLLIGRALLWYVDDNVIMDRIYGTDVTIERFKQYAVDNGFYHKPKQNFEDCTRFVSGGKETEIQAKINISLNAGDYCPFLDTFKYVKFGDYISNSDSFDYDAIADKTDGYIEGYVCDVCGCCCDEEYLTSTSDGDRVCESCLENYCYCEHCNEYYHIDYCISDINGDYYCEDCANRALNYCDYCGCYSTDNTTHTEDGQEVCEICLENYFSFCDVCGSYYPTEDTNYLHYSRQTVCEDCLNSDFTHCNNCNEFIPNSEIIDYICPNCEVCFYPLLKTQTLEKKAI